MQPGELGLRDDVRDRRHTLSLVGELDLATAGKLEATIGKICAEGARAVVLDLSELAFIDSTGLRAILIGNDLCQEHHCEFAVVPGGEQVQRLFELTGVIDKLPFRAPPA